MNLNSVKPRDKIRDRNQSYDAELAGSISRNKLYKGNVDDEYDYGDGCDMEGSRGKKGKPARPSVRPRVDGVNRISTQQERCQFCFENADRPKHLVIAMANSTYLMIPPRTSLVPFHCFIVPMQVFHLLSHCTGVGLSFFPCAIVSNSTTNYCETDFPGPDSPQYWS